MNTEILASFASGLAQPFKLKRNPDFPNVAAVLDDFSVHCFSEVANIWQIDPRRPDLDLNFVEFDFLLVESAWSGNSGRWKYMVTSNSGPKPPLVRLVQECRKRGIPTVFWNKEDPPHFEEFIKTASLFDFVFTSDAEMIPRYQERIPDAKVELLRFAAAPNLHSPAQTSDFRSGDIAFAGQYFAHKFPERRMQMETLFPAAAKYDFSIFSRALGGDERYQFPQPYAQYVVGSLPYSKMVEEYRRHKVFLNVNSVVGSKTMCARRVFELGACKTAVVGTHSDAIRSVYDENEVLLSDDPAEISRFFSMLLTDELQRRSLVQKAWRKTLSSHTYGHRIEQIQRAIGNAVAQKKIHINVYLHVSNRGNVKNLLKDLADQRFNDAEAVGISVTIIPGTSDDPEYAEDLLREAAVNSGNPSVSESTDIYVAYLTSDIRVGRYYFQDLIYTLKQQKCSFAAKILSNSITEIQLTEEKFSLKLPEYGWLMKPKNNDGGFPFNLDSVSGEIETVEVGEDSKCYISDPFELTEATDLNTLSMVFN